MTASSDATRAFPPHPLVAGDEWDQLNAPPLEGRHINPLLERSADMTLDRCALFCAGFAFFKVAPLPNGSSSGARCGCLGTYPYANRTSADGNSR